jgi:predicted RNase H-like HicB family nuclease
MLSDYIQAAMNDATYEIIDDPWPYYAEINRLKGLWASGKTLKECRRNLAEALKEWIALSLQLGHPLPAYDGVTFCDS